MSAEPKPFASLSSGLQGFGQINGAGLEDLGWNDLGFEPPKPAVTPIRDDEHDAFGEELPVPPVRNPLAALTPIGSPVHDQQAEIEDRFTGDNEDEAVDEDYDDTAELYEPEETEEAVAAPAVEPAAPVREVHPAVAAVVPVAAPRRASRARSAPGAKGKAAFTLRLDSERHLKLRLACAVRGRSAQLLVTDALDALLSAMPELEDMAGKANRKG